MKTIRGLIAFSLISPAVAAAAAGERGEPWRRHTIDASSSGADGVRLADVNGDGHPDIATGWEEGGLVRLYLNPGPAAATKPWPAVTVGRVKSPEDAVLVDLDADGAMDVVSSCEGNVKTMWVHWSPRDPAKRLQETSWRTEAIPASRGVTRWMFTAPADLDGDGKAELVAGSKDPGGTVGFFASAGDARDLASWLWTPLYTAGWVMTVACVDMDGDGDLDILASDRKGARRGCLWLESPGKSRINDPKAWREHRIGGLDREVMFSSMGDLDGDGVNELVTATRGKELVIDRRNGDGWTRSVVALPEGIGTAKATGIGDIDLDGRADIVFSCENSKDASGVLWLSHAKDDAKSAWRGHEISGREGVKYDLVALLDLDGDGDLDVLTCEERDGLGVIWYENPARSREIAAAERRPLVLVTNDDGVRSDGLRALVVALESFADVIVAAPATNVSGASQSVTIRGEFTIEELDRADALAEKAPAFEEGPGRTPTRFWALGTTPASCVHVAMNVLSTEREIDLVVSGINRGQNLGADIPLSGTVGAARMAADAGVPGLALSLHFLSKRYGDAAILGARIARRMLEEKPSGDAGRALVLNVNIPVGVASRWKAARILPPGKGAFRVGYRRDKDESGRDVLRASIGLNPGPFEEGTDTRALLEGHVTITPIGLRGAPPAWIAELEKLPLGSN